MAHSGTLGNPLTPPRSGGELRRGALVALGVHGILFAALTVNIPWTPPPPKVVAAELWSAVPQSAPLPAAAEPVTPPTEPPPEVKPDPTPPAKTAPPEPKVAPKIPDKQADAQIAIEQEKKARAEKEKIEKARLEKVAKEKADKEKADREKLEKEKLAREKAQKAEKAEKAEAQKRAAAEEARVAQMREENLKRMMGQIGPAGSTGTGGTATKEASYSSSYEGKIRAAIKTNLIFNRSFTGNPKVIVEIRVGPSGTIISQRIKTRSGNPDWDEAVVRAVERTGTLPRDVDGRVPDLLEVTYGPADLMKN